MKCIWVSVLLVLTRSFSHQSHGARRTSLRPNPRLGGAPEQRELPRVGPSLQRRRRMEVENPLFVKEVVYV